MGGNFGIPFLLPISYYKPTMDRMDLDRLFLLENLGDSFNWLLVFTPKIYEPWSILTIWLMVIPSIIRILIMVIINPYEPLDD